MNGLYQTKHFGRNWTRIDIPQVSLISSAPPLGSLNLGGGIGYGSNNEAQRPDTDLFSKTEAGSAPTGLNNVSLAIDPQNPNIVFIGGLGAGNDASLPS